MEPKKSLVYGYKQGAPTELKNILLIVSQGSRLFIEKKHATFGLQRSLQWALSSKSDLLRISLYLFLVNKLSVFNHKEIL